MIDFSTGNAGPLMLGLLGCLLLLPPARRGRHYYRIRRSKRVLKRLAELPPAQLIAYLRKVDPYTVEELLLSAIDHHHPRVKVIRNRRYTGDGGIDGRFLTAAGEVVLIQSKRYSGYINAIDVRAFAEIVSRQGAAGGLFIHTGKTGKAAWQAAKETGIQIISGDRLCRLITLGTLPLASCKPPAP